MEEDHDLVTYQAVQSAGILLSIGISVAVIMSQKNKDEKRKFLKADYDKVKLYHVKQKENLHI